MWPNALVKVLLLFVWMSVTDASLHERAEAQRRKDGGTETEGIAIDVMYKLPPTATGYITLVNVSLISLGFLLGVTALLVFRLAIPNKSKEISAV